MSIVFLKFLVLCTLQNAKNEELENVKECVEYKIDRLDLDQKYYISKA